jgi:hypothetical protein
MQISAQKQIISIQPYPLFIDALVFAIDTLWLWEEKEVS